MRRVSFKTARNGFSLLEICVSFLVLSFTVVALFTTITTGAVTDHKMELLAVVDQALSSLADEARAQPFEELAELEGSRTLTVSGYSFETHTRLEELGDFNEEQGKLVIIELRWEDDIGKTVRVKKVARSNL